MHYLLKRKSFIIGVVVLSFIVCLGLFGPNYAPDPRAQVRNDNGRLVINEPPGDKGGLLGTDQSAQDYFSNVVTGIQNSLKVGITVGIITILTSTLVGGVAAFKGGMVDEIAMLFTNIILVFPVLPALLVLSAIQQERSLNLIIGIISLISWPWAARAIRSQVLSLKERDFVHLSRVSGESDFKIAIFEVLPHLLSYLALVFAISIGAAILTEAGISVVGLGPENIVTLGILLQRSIEFESIRLGYWWIFITPGVILTGFMFSLYLIQSNMDAVFNPRLREE